MLDVTEKQTKIADFKAEAEAFLVANPDIEKIQLLYQGYCGPLRGKWLPVSMMSKIINRAVRMPLSTVALDIWGEDVSETGLAIERGDPDGACVPIANTLRRVPWSNRPTAQVMIHFEDMTTGKPSLHDPRSVLEGVVERFKEKGLTPVVATELEFYLTDRHSDENGFPQPPLVPGTKERLGRSQIYEIEVMEDFHDVLADINEACKAQGIPADTTIAEFGPGQFEINLLHVTDALQAAEHCLLFKRVVKAVARKHGLDATFMAKPYGEQAGNGFHVHASVLDEQGNNIFDSGTNEANDLLKHAVGGLLATMKDMQLIFAPHANSYRRLQPASYAPITPCWGYDHRAAAVRVPESQGAGARLEHRVSGADANPYLVVAAILQGMLDGMNEGIDPGAPIETLEDVDNYKPLANNWEMAIANWQHSPKARELGSLEFYEAFTTGRVCEQNVFATTITQFECNAYQRKV